MHDYDAIVIGSGSGGLTAALAMARAGKRVVVFEQHYLPGGYSQSFVLKGFRFSPGIHYVGALGPGAGLRRIYEGLGVANETIGSISWVPREHNPHSQTLPPGTAEVVPRQPAADDRDADAPVAATTGAREADEAETTSRRGQGVRWAALMARTFGVDVLACPRCGGRLRLLALIEQAPVIERILRHLGLPTEVPAPCPARAPPRPSEWDDEGSGFDAGA